MNDINEEQSVISSMGSLMSNAGSGWIYNLGGFAIEHFMIGYVLQKHGVRAALQVAEGRCGMYPYPAASLVLVLLENGPKNMDKLEELEKLVRFKRMIQPSESLHTLSEWRSGTYTEWYAMCGVVLAHPDILDLSCFRNIVSASSIELLTMLYKFVDVMREPLAEAGIPMTHTKESIIRFAVCLLYKDQYLTDVDYEVA